MSPHLLALPPRPPPAWNRPLHHSSSQGSDAAEGCATGPAAFQTIDFGCFKLGFNGYIYSMYDFVWFFGIAGGSMMFNADLMGVNGDSFGSTVWDCWGFMGFNGDVP